MSTHPTTILASETRVLKSEHTGREYCLKISLPYAYEKPWVSGPTYQHYPAQWPVVYLLDANWFFGMVTDMTRNMAFCGGTTDAIVVGIGYPEADDPQETFLNGMARRANDLLPAQDEVAEKNSRNFTGRPASTGDGMRFHQFIRNEVIPMIERDFRADPARRILVGHSFSGLFGAFALLHEPELFDAYILASPSIGAADRFVFKQEEAYAREHKVLKARVHLSAAEFDEDADTPMVGDMFHFAALLASRNYEGLTLTKQLFANMNHCEVVAPAFHAGLLWALKR